MEEERSESFDSGSSLLQSSGIESEKEEVPQVNQAKAKGPGVPAPAGKPPPAAAVPPPPKPGTPSHPRCPVRLRKRVNRREKAFANSDPLCRPVSPRQTTGANQMFMVTYIRASLRRTRDFAGACEQLRRGFSSATKAHRPKVGPCRQLAESMTNSKVAYPQIPEPLIQEYTIKCRVTYSLIMPYRDPWL